MVAEVFDLIEVKFVTLTLAARPGCSSSQAALILLISSSLCVSLLIVTSSPSNFVH